MEVATSLDVRVMLIDAAARLLMFDWKHDLPQSRTTKDWDLAVKLESWEKALLWDDQLVSGWPQSLCMNRTLADATRFFLEGSLTEPSPGRVLLPFLPDRHARTAGGVQR
ncbi:MAG TPA: hypothetical protein VGV87_24515 [Blastocatellia bacterium]|nr:hypothetical protein [Blastocatellia bacterium]